MKPDGPIKLLAELRDLQIVDKDDRICGICDDIELEGKPGGPLRIKALLVGPGAYEHRVPRWLFAVVRLVAGRSVTRVPWSSVETVTSRIRLKTTGEAQGLRQVEDRLAGWFGRLPFA